MATAVDQSFTQFGERPPDNWWFGVTVELEKYLEWRVEELLEIPAAVHFVSLEPLLGEVDISKYIGAEWSDLGLWIQNREAAFSEMPRIDWVIAGAETGPGARPAKLNWFRSIRDQCEAVSIPFFLKQVSSDKNRILDTRIWNQFP